MHLTTSNKLITNRKKGYTWGVLWELVRIQRLDSDQSITPGVCRSLAGSNKDVGPNMRTILLGTGLEESSVPDLGKAERDAKVRRRRLYFVFSELIGASLHGSISTLRSYGSIVLLPASWTMVGGWSLLSGSPNRSPFNNNRPSNVLRPDLAGGLVQVPL